MLKICLTGHGYGEQHFAKLKANGFEVTHKTNHVTQTELLSILPEFDAYVLGGDERFTTQELKQPGKLRVISFVGSGYTAFIDEQAAKKCNIAIKNTPAVNAPAVAEHIIGLLLGMQRRLFQQNWQVKHNSVSSCNTEELSSLCIGIVGLGAIGSRVAKILRQGFDSKVIYTSNNRKYDLEKGLNLTFVSMNELFSSSDIIVFSLPTNPNTEYFVNDSLLSQTKDGVILINAAGARLIEPVALKKYIDNQKIASAAFDGYYIEPLPNVAEDPFHLLSLSDERFVVTPHIAAKTTQSWNRMLDMSIDNVIHFFQEPAK